MSEPIHPSASTTSPISAVLWNICCIMGLGQFMLGQHAKGATILVFSYLMAAVSGGFAVPILWIVVGMDAYAIASKLQRGRSVGQWEFF